MPGSLHTHQLPAEGLAGWATDAALTTVPIPAVALERILEPGWPELRRRATVSWERPSRRSALFGFGVAARLGGSRSSPFSEVAVRLDALFSGAGHEGLGGGPRPRAFGGARFTPGGTHIDPAWDAFGGWEFTVPSLLVAIEDGQVSASLTLAEGSAPSPADLESCIDRLLASPAEPACELYLHDGALHPPLRAQPPSDPDGWSRMVAGGLHDIAAGRYRKVVLARSVDMPMPAGVDVGHVLSALATRYANCYVFKYRAGGATWLGASPELLASLTRPIVRAASLAGSRPRGADTAFDDRLRAELLASPKEREEHKIVCTALQASLAPFCSDLYHPAEPSVLRMSNIQHLYTPFEGTAYPGVNLLDIVANLHPTPAVGGWPRENALDAIGRLEQMDRGWYGGPIGWLDANGDGEFAVGLRSALIAGNVARLYAGAGIVAGSDPSREYAETEAKLRPLRESLAAVR